MAEASNNLFPEDEQSLEMLANMGVGHWVYDHVADRIRFSQKLESLVGIEGLDRDGCPLADWQARMHPEDREVMRTTLARCWREGVPAKVQYRFGRGDGNWYHAETWISVAERDAEGRPLVSRGVRIDLTARREGELLLRLQQDFTRLLAESPDREALQRGILETALLLPELDCGAFFWKSPDGGYRMAANLGFSEDFISRFGEMWPGSRWADLVENQDRICSCTQTSECCTHPQLVRDLEIAGEGITAFTLLPMQVYGRSGACLGLASRHAANLSPATTQALGSLARQFGQALERLQAREEAASQRRNLERVMDNIQDYLFVLDANARILFVNRAVKEGLGYGDTLVGRSGMEVRRPEIREEAARIVGEILAGQRSHCTLPLMKADGGEIPVDTRFVPSEWDGQPCMLALARDVSEMRAAQETLEKERRFLKTLVRSIPDLVWLKDPDGVYLAANPVTERFMGLPSDSLVGRTDHDFFPPALADALRRKDAEAALAGVPIVTCEQVPKGDGEMATLETVKIATYDPEGRLVGVLGLARDITERIRTEEELRGYRDHLESLVQDRTAELEKARVVAEQASRAKSEFLSSMSHELRTPMNAILGFGQLLEMDDRLGQDQMDFVKEIIKAGEHLLELINEVLDLAKIDAGRVELSLEPVDVGQVVEECRTLVHPLAGKRGISLETYLSSGAVVRADRVRFKQALLNLMSNAIKYNREGGQVRVGLMSPHPGWLRIAVTDTGPGVPADKVDDLFQPFKRLGAEQSGIEGTGIGLTITRRLVELMGGGVGVESMPGVGSTFWIDLPADAMHNGDGLHEETWLPGGLEESSGRVGRVLYIEDNPANLKLVSQILGRRRHIQLMAAHTPELGMELALGHQPDLILLDINLPRMNGYQVLEAFKGNPHLRDIPVVAITANAMPGDIEKGKAAGFVDYLTKPLDIRRFIETVEGLLPNE